MTGRVRRSRRLVLGGLLLVAVSVGVGGASAATSKSCREGRSLLQCNEKIGIYDDSYVASIGGFGDLVLFETKLPLPLGNRALSQFWHYQTATSIARLQFESAIINQETDENIEAVAKRATLAVPVVHASGVIDRRDARTLSALLRSEQEQVLNLAAMNTALNRATAALITRTRTDWLHYQESAAGGFALHAAAATQRMIRLQHAAERVLVGRNLLFGVGPVDLALAQRAVKRSRSFTPSIVAILTRYGVAAAVRASAEVEFALANLGPTSVSLTQYLGSSTLTGGERDLIRALRHFAARIPHHGRPPTA